MFRSRFELLIVMALAFPVLAQQGFRGERDGEGDRPRWVQRMLDQLADDLELDESQRTQMQAVADEQGRRMREMGRLFRDIRQAERDGDDALAEELRAQLPERPAEGWNPRTQFFDELEPILRDDQLLRLDEIRERFPGRGEERMNRFADDLNLDEGQRVQLEEASAELRSRMMAQGEQWRELRPLYDELREAREAGDDELAAEIEAEIEELRPNPGRGMEEFFDQVEGFLREDQIPALNEMRAEAAEMRQRFSERRGAEFGRDVEESAAETLGRLEEEVDLGDLELTDEQRAEFARTIEGLQARADQMSAAEVRAEALGSLKKVLREDQMGAFDEIQRSVLTARQRGGVEVDDVRVVLRAARAADLSREQMDKLKEIQRTAGVKYRQVRRDPDKVARLAEEVRAEIETMLSAEQARAFERELERVTQRNRRAGR